MNEERAHRTGAPQRAERGMILVVCLVMIVVLAAVASAFIGTGVSTSGHRQAGLRRARVLYVAEAGMGRAVGDLNAGGDGEFGAGGADIAFGGGTYSVNATDNGDGTYTILSVGQIKEQKRAIEGVVTPIEYVRFSKAMIGNLTIDAGGGAFVDSYDNTLGSYAAQAVNLNPVTGDMYAGTMGNIAANQDIVLGGGAVIMGSATPGPGYSVRTGGGPVYVEGSTAPAMDPEPIYEVPYEPPFASLGSFSAGVSTVMGDGVYRYDDFLVGNAKTLTITGDVTIYVDNNLDIKALGEVIVETGGSLEIYHNGDTFNLSGQTMINKNEAPSAMKIFSAATDINIAGATGFYGAIFAPNAIAKMTGTNELFGSLVAASVSILGTADFHFDEDLLRSKEEVGMTLSSWRRVPAD